MSDVHLRVLEGKGGKKHLEKLKSLYRTVEWDAALLCFWQETEWRPGTGRGLLGKITWKA